MMEKDWKYFMKFDTIPDIRDTMLFPDYPDRGPNFDERLYISTDGKIEDMIAEDNQAYIDKVNSGGKIEH
jgi:hypothetical protein